MNNVMKSLLLIESFDLNHLVEEYREFFLAILPSVFIFAVIVEYFDRLEPFSLLRRSDLDYDSYVRDKLLSFFNRSFFRYSR